MCGDHLNGQADTRQFAARGNLGQGLEGLAGVGADQQFNLLQAVGGGITAGLWAQFDHKAAPGHAQALDLFFYGSAQACCGQAAQIAQFPCALLIVAGKGRQLIGQALDVFIVGVEGLQLIQQFLLQGGHFGGLDPMFARQGINGVEALFEVLQTARVGVEMVDKAVEFPHRLFDLNLCAGQQVSGFAQRARVAVDARQAVEAGCQCIKHIAGIAFAALLDHLSADGQQGFGVGQVFVFLLQLFQFVLTQRECFQLFKLIAQQLMACTLFIARVGQVLKLLFGLAPALCRQLHLAGQVGGAGEFVEQATVGVGLEQRLVFMLTVDVDQQLAQCFEVALGAGRAVDIAARAAFGGDDPAQDARAVAFKVALGQPGPGFGDVLQVERGQDIGLVGSGAHDAAVGAVAKGEAQCIEHDRFAGASLASDYTHPAIQFQIEMFNDGVVVYGQVHQHGSCSKT